MMSEKPPHPPVKSTAMGRCIVVFGTKGGVGKTVLATNLAVCLAQRSNTRVCLVDLDVMATGDLTRMLRLNVKEAVVRYVGYMKRQPAPDTLPLDGLAVPHTSGIHVVQCLDTPRHGYLLDRPLVQCLFRTLKARYHYIVVDAGKGLTDPLVATFDQANLILLVTTPEIIALYETKWAMNLIEGLLFPSNLVKAVLNRAESRGGVTSQDARQAISCELIAEIPSDGRAIVTSINEGVPVVLHDRKAKASEAFRQFAHTLATTPTLFLSTQEVVRRRQSVDGSVSGTGGFTLSSTKLYTSLQEQAEELMPDDEIVRLKQRVHEQLVVELDLKKVDLALLTNQSNMQQMRQRCEQVVASLLSRETGGVISSHEVRARLVKEILDEALGLGPLEELLADPTVSDILVNNKDQVYV